MNINTEYNVETTFYFFCMSRLSRYDLISRIRITCLISRVYFYSRMRSTLRNTSCVKFSFHIIDVFHLNKISFTLYQKHYTNLFQIYYFDRNIKRCRFASCKQTRFDFYSIIISHIIFNFYINIINQIVFFANNYTNRYNIRVANAILQNDNRRDVNFAQNDKNNIHSNFDSLQIRISIKRVLKISLLRSTINFQKNV